MGKKQILIVAVLVIACLMFGGCGEKKSETTGSTVIEGTAEDYLDVEVAGGLDKTPVDNPLEEASTETELDIKKNEFLKIIDDARADFEEIDLDNIPDVKVRNLSFEEYLLSSKKERPNITGKLQNIWNTKSVSDIDIEKPLFDGELISLDGNLYATENDKMISKVDVSNGTHDLGFVPEKTELIYFDSGKKLIHYPFLIRDNIVIFDNIKKSFFTTDELNETKETDPDYFNIRFTYKGSSYYSKIFHYNPKNGLLITFDKEQSESENAEYVCIYYFSLKNMELIKKIDEKVKPNCYDVLYDGKDIIINILPCDEDSMKVRYPESSQKAEVSFYPEMVGKFLYYDNTLVEVTIENLLKLYGEPDIDLDALSKYSGYHVSGGLTGSHINNGFIINHHLFYTTSDYNESGPFSTAHMLDLKTGTEKWQTEIGIIRNKVFLENSVLFLVYNGNNLNDLFYLDFKNGEKIIATENFEIKHQRESLSSPLSDFSIGMKVLDDSVLINDFHYLSSMQSQQP